MTRTSTPIIPTLEGPIRGVVEDDVFVFKGIPYAAPPVDDLRWRAPMPVVPWEKELHLNDYSHSSWQDPEECIKSGGGDPGTLHEDCLYLNVWAPPHHHAKRHPGLPVMVWIHGGAFIIGAGGLPPYIGAPLVKRGAVVVTLNYRLGRLGFFAHPALDRETPEGELPVNNFGLLDQIAALQWVQRNIASFGGDPHNVTIFGQSAGGKSVLSLFVSPLARGLFHKGIAQSVYRLSEPTREKALERGVKTATGVGLDGAEATAAELRALPASAFVDIDKDTEKRKGTSNAPNAISGDAVLPRSILDAFGAGEDLPLPLIIGNTSDDASVVKDFGLPLVLIAASVPDEYRPLTTYYPDVSGWDGTEMGRRTGRDALFTALAHRIAEKRGGRAPTFRYYFDYTAVGLRPTVKKGTRHGDDIIYVMATGDLCPPTQGIFTDADREVERRVSEYWLEFARTGAPACGGSPEWISHEAGRDRLLLLSGAIELKTDYMKAHMANFDGIGAHLDGVAAGA